MRARYYDPSTGRFISKDPVEGILINPQTQNPYAYAGNDPINRADPSGLWWGPFSVDNIHKDWDNCNYGTAIAKGAVVAVGTGAAAAGAVYLGAVAVGAVGVEAAVGGTLIGGKITGYTNHGLMEAIGRDGGRGVNPNAMLNAIRNPSEVINQVDKLGRVSTLYKGDSATVVLNELGEIITTWGQPRNLNP